MQVMNNMLGSLTQEGDQGWTMCSLVLRNLLVHNFGALNMFDALLAKRNGNKDVSTSVKAWLRKVGLACKEATEAHVHAEHMCALWPTTRLGFSEPDTLDAYRAQSMQCMEALKKLEGAKKLCRTAKCAAKRATTAAADDDGSVDV